MIRLARSLLLAAVLLCLAAPAAAADPDIVLEPAGTFAFGSVTLGEAAGLEVAVVNEGTTAGTIAASSITGSPSFGIAIDDCAGLTLEPNEFCVVPVGFAPKLPGPLSAQLRVPHDGPGSPAPLSLGGVGVKAPEPPPPGPPFTWTPGALDFGTVVVGAAAPRAARTVELAKATPSTPVSVLVEGADALSFRVLGLLSPCDTRATACKLTVVFAPNRAGRHQATLV